MPKLDETPAINKRDLWVNIATSTLELMRIIGFLTRATQSLRGERESPIHKAVYDLSRKAMSLQQVINTTDSAVSSYQHLYGLMKPIPPEPDPPPAGVDWPWPHDPPPMGPAPKRRGKMSFESIVDDNVDEGFRQWNAHRLARHAHVSSLKDFYKAAKRTGQVQPEYRVHTDLLRHHIKKHIHAAKKDYKGYSSQFPSVHASIGAIIHTASHS